MNKFRRRKCTGETTGIVRKVWINDNGNRRLTVEYEVRGVIYKHKENITVYTEPIKAGKIPIGIRKHEYVTAGIGDQVAVIYNPDKPKMACLRDNIGKFV